MDVKKGLEILKNYVKNEKMISHCIASSAIMKKLAKIFNEDENKWALAGLLHDVDVELTNGDPNTHGQVAKEILKKYNIDNEIIEAISLHNEVSAKEPRSKPFHHALAAAETISGLIFATALVYPTKKISSVKPSSVIKRMKEKRFAASVKRENIMECEKIGIPLDKFVEIALDALKEIENELTL